MSVIFIKTSKTLIVSEALNRLSGGVNYCDKPAKSLCRHPFPLVWGWRSLVSIWEKADRLLVPVRSRSVRSNTYAFLDPSLKLVAFLLNYFTCFPIHNMIVLTDVVCYG